MAVWGKLTIGSNTIANTSGVLEVDGREQIALERSDRDAQLLLTIDVFDAARKHVAKLRRNAWTFQGDDFQITTNPKSLTLVEKATGKVVVEAAVVGRDAIEVRRGSFYTPSGVPVEIEPTHLRIGGVTLSGNYIDVGGAAFVLTSTGFAIGRAGGKAK